LSLPQFLQQGCRRAGGAVTAACLLAWAGAGAAGTAVAEAWPVQVAQATPPADAAAPARRTRAAAFRPTLKFGVEEFRAEASALPDAPAGDTRFELLATPYVAWQPAREWEFRAGARLTAEHQSGGLADVERARATLGDTWARWRSGDTRLTAGWQTIVWGRVDEVPLIDRVSRVDLNRLVLDDLEQRRLPLPAVRAEHTMDAWRIDAVVLPRFDGAALPAPSSVWSPIDRLEGRLLGIEGDPTFAAFVRTASLRRDDGGFGGAAVRLTRTGEPPADFGLTLGRVRQSLPYVVVDPLAGTLTTTHPMQRFVALDAEVVAGDVTWRSELGYTPDQPMTALDGRRLDARAWEWVAAAEWFPGGKDVRVNVQLLARSVRAGQPTLELDEYVALNGEVESTFAQGRWKFALRFNTALNVSDHYLAPKLSYLGWEPHEVYVVLRSFGGEARTLGGFHRRHDTAAIGFKTRF
jgi:hypothetical protein